MPEGPEIRRAADRVAAVLVGRRLDEAWFAFERLAAHVPGLRGTRVAAVETRGKAMLTHFDSGQTLFSHNQLYGRWFVRRRDDYPETGRSLRVALHTAEHSALLYSASEVDLLPTDGLAAQPYLGRLGPDVLSDSLTRDTVIERLEDERFYRRRLAGLYLDQGFLAGLGNYLRTEILHCARVHPSRRPADLSQKKLDQLAGQTLALPRRSYRTGGVTLDAARRGGGRRNRFWAFGRQGRPCYACGTALRRETLAGRRLYLCPNCQA